MIHNIAAGAEKVQKFKSSKVEIDIKININCLN